MSGSITLRGKALLFTREALRRLAEDYQIEMASHGISDDRIGELGNDLGLVECILVDMERAENGENI